MTFKNLIYLGVTLLFISSCGSKVEQGVTESGFNYFHYVKNGGDLPQEGDQVRFYERVLLGQDSVLMEQERTVQLPPRDQVTGPAPNYELLFKLSAGDSAAVYMTGDNMEKFGLQKSDTLFYHIGFKEIVKTKAELDAEMEESQQAMVAIESMVNKTLNDYKSGALNANLITTESGLKYIIHDQGSGEPVLAGKSAEVHYYGMLVSEGTMFDNSYSRGQPLNFTVGTGQVIPGWDEGLQLLKVGSKATFFIPSDLAYGPNGNQGIPGNAELLFYVEVVGAE
jgi:FKBP-type peptidyl-prolyl cis-trans isomerase FkpA